MLPRVTNPGQHADIDNGADEYDDNERFKRPGRAWGDQSSAGVSVFHTSGRLSATSEWTSTWHYSTSRCISVPFNGKEVSE